MNTDGIVEFVADPLRLTLIVAAIVVVLAIVFLGRRSNRKRDLLYKRYSEKNYSFGSPPADTLVDEEVIVLPRRKKESEVIAEKEAGFSAHHDENADSVPDALDVISAEPPRREPVFDKNPSFTKPRKATVSKSKPAPSSRQEKKAVKEEVVVKRSQPVKVAKPVKQQFVVLHIIAEDGRPFGGKEIFEATQTLGMAMGKHDVFHYPADSAYVGDSAFCMVNMTPEGNFDVDNLSETQTSGVSLILTLPTTYSDGLTVFSNMIAVAHALVKKLGGGDIVDQTRLPLTAELMTSIQADIVKFENQISATNPVLET